MVTAWKAEEVQKRLATRAEEIRKQVESGDDLAAIATTAGVTVETASGVTRVGDPPAGLGQPVVEAAFGGPQGFAAIADGDAGSKIVVVTTAVTVPPYFSGAPDLAQAEEQFSGEFSNDILTQYVYQLQQQLGVTVNQAALQAAISAFRPNL